MPVCITVDSFQRTRSWLICQSKKYSKLLFVLGTTSNGGKRTTHSVVVDSYHKLSLVRESYLCSSCPPFEAGRLKRCYKKAKSFEQARLVHVTRCKFTGEILSCFTGVYTNFSCRQQNHLQHLPSWGAVNLVKIHIFQCHGTEIVLQFPR